MGEDERKIARARVAQLVKNFRLNEGDYLRPNYNETQARTDFITPLLEAFGWDVHNHASLPLSLREVVEEATVEVGEERLTKRPDYELRLARQRKLFVEAKKPSVRVDRDRNAAFQTRRYGYSGSLPISILTNFHQLAIYDCGPIPAPTDDPAVARIALLSYDEFEIRFDELWSLLSRTTVYSGEFDRRFAVEGTRRGAAQFDDLFLAQVKSWRARLAVDIHRNSPSLTPPELTYAVQLFLSRIVFLRICEDRNIERYETLKNLSPVNTFDALVAELRRADTFYDSGLFSLLNDARLGVRISDETLRSIVAELYYPQSPYTFSVVETEVLGEIYEQFLGDIITVEAGVVAIAHRPEVRESGGVVPTPRYIVEAILQRSLVPLLAGKSPDDLQGFSVADICCGSGVFLLSVYEYLLDHHLEWYLANDPTTHRGTRIYEGVGGQWHLTFAERRRILLDHIRGVDIDANAVEVARFSLLLKLIESESAASLQEYVDQSRSAALPELETIIKCGNSLVSLTEWVAVSGNMSAALMEKVNPFDWAVNFPDDFARGGFDAIVINPPYTRIQHMQTYMPEELGYYQSPRSPYETAREGNFDKYALFIERCGRLIRQDGALGLIVPHKFMTTQAGRPLRRLIARRRTLKDIVHFGVKPVFGRGISNYTCVMVMDENHSDVVAVEMPGALETWRYGTPGTLSRIPADEITEEPWQFANAETQALFARVRAAFPRQLNEVADVSVGVQTSADSIYLFRPVAESADTLSLHWNNRDWPIERGILRPSLDKVSVYAYERAQPNAWMIFPYDMVVTNGVTSARLFQPHEMTSRFPLAYAYLTARRAELENRGVTGGAAAERQFYQFGRSQSLTKIDSPKIIVQVLTLDARNGYDDQNTVITGGGNGPYYMVRANSDSGLTIEYLLAILNHPLSEAFIRTETSTFRGGYYSHGKQYIQRLPVPIPTALMQDEISELVRELIQVQDDFKLAKTPRQRDLRQSYANSLRERIEACISDAFGLSDEDIAVIMDVPIPG